MISVINFENFKLKPVEELDQELKNLMVDIVAKYKQQDSFSCGIGMRNTDYRRRKIRLCRAVIERNVQILKDSISDTESPEYQAVKALEEQAIRALAFGALNTTLPFEYPLELADQLNDEEIVKFLKDNHGFLFL